VFREHCPARRRLRMTRMHDEPRHAEYRIRAIAVYCLSHRLYAGIGEFVRRVGPGVDVTCVLGAL